ncbi:MAG: Crp/Fnr family transcriptional regulator [Hyphomicrobiales bacterium]
MGDGQPPFDPNIFSNMQQGVTLTTLREGQILFTQGDPADSVFYFEKGRFKVTVLSAQGKEAILAILGAGDFCGEGCLAGQVVRMASVVAMTDCVAVRIEKAAMIRLMREEPAVSEMFVAHLLARNIRVELDLVDHLFNSTEKRLARLLLILASFGKEGKPEPVLPPIRQETLAEMIGTTRSRVSFFMNKFRQLGFIDYNGHLEVHSSLMSVILNDFSEPDGRVGNHMRRPRGSLENHRRIA